MRPLVLGSRAGLVEPVRRHAEAGGVAADLVERDQPQVTVESGVLHALGSRRTGRLLEAIDELVFQGATLLQREDAVKEAQELGVEIGGSPGGIGEGIVEGLPVGRRDLAARISLP